MRRAPAPPRPVPLADDPTWYKDAVIYEVRTRSFFDSNDDGVGDLRGLTSKLDYIADLGVTAIWLLPFYPSPGRDDGYDISDYTGVHPEVGTLEDFEQLLAEAHRRGIRVIIELVLNHTSDQHPWFQRARYAPAGSPERDFYVWSDTPDRYREARIVFKDFEVSNWSSDRVAGAYYWHRFYAHQPDLNFENPAVQEALFGVVNFWLGRGVDGLRLDAVPYLYEEDDTNCENLPKTHVLLKKLRAHVDAKWKNRMLLAEANQWPDDAAAYFGQGDECHMNFHFPLMPRMFMAVHMEDRLPLVDIFAQTPDVDPTCQWALFLRNHDELTLEMVTDEERDYMYRAYAHQAAMRINLGIRRRLAPLVGNNRRKIELLSGLLLSLPGTPVLYYGDEIGMGDNVYLGDRNGVRTPMQWSMDHNGGFSRANPQRLILPVVIDPEYHYESINVENQQHNPTSLLWWTKRLIALRKRFPAFGRGTIEFLAPANPCVFAFVREHQGKSVLVVANLSRFAQCAELNLSKHAGSTPVEVFGKARFPGVTAAPYVVTLGPHGFYWFALDQPAPASERVSSIPPVVLRVECESPDTVLLATGEGIDERALLEEPLKAFLASRRWSRDDSAIVSARIDEGFKLGTPEQPLYVVIVRVEYVNGQSIPCALPLAIVSEESRPPAAGVVARLETRAAGPKLLLDAIDDPAAARALLEAFAKDAAIPGADWELGISGAPGVALDASEAAPQRIGRERDDTLVRFGERYLLKIVRHVLEGVSPDLEIGRTLAVRESDLAPPLLRAVELRRSGVEPLTVALVQGFVANGGTAWEFTLAELGRFYDRAVARAAAGSPELPAPPAQSPFALMDKEPPSEVAAMIGGHRDYFAQLGRRVAELHRVLSAEPSDPALAPQAYSPLDRRAKYQSLRTLAGRVLRTLRQELAALPPRARAEAERLLAREADVLRAFEPLLASKAPAYRVRVHGNLHLGHVLYTGKGFVFTDFDGLHHMTLAERRRKRSPLIDVASVVRSADYAAIKVLFDPARVRESDVEVARPWASHWASWVSAAFVRAYFLSLEGAPILPSDPADAAAFLDAFVMERALHQLRLQLQDAGGGVAIAIGGILRVLGAA